MGEEYREKAFQGEKKKDTLKGTVNNLHITIQSFLNNKMSWLKQEFLN